MTGESVDAKARRLLGAGRVLVQRVDGEDVEALVAGDSCGSVRDGYRVERTPARWSCTCPSRRRCSHVAAVVLVTRVTGDAASTSTGDAAPFAFSGGPP